MTDLQTYFESPQEETDILEFKSGDVEIENLYKEVSAFLNTEGGLIRFNEIPNVLGKKFSLSRSSEQVLVPVVSLPFKFTIYHNISEYIIFVGYWSKYNDFDFQYWTYDPIKQQIVCADKMKYENTSFLDEVERLK